MTRTITKSASWAIVLYLTLHGSQLTAHHGLDQYDTSTLIELHGTVAGFELLEPHSFLYIDVDNGDGTITPWVVEGGPARGIIAAGLSKKFLSGRPGVSARVFQSKDKRCSPTCKANGRDFRFN